MQPQIQRNKVITILKLHCRRRRAVPLLQDATQLLDGVRRARTRNGCIPWHEDRRLAVVREGPGLHQSGTKSPEQAEQKRETFVSDLLSAQNVPVLFDEVPAEPALQCRGQRRNRSRSKDKEFQRQSGALQT